MVEGFLVLDIIILAITFFVVVINDVGAGPFSFIIDKPSNKAGEIAIIALLRTALLRQ